MELAAKQAAEAWQLGSWPLKARALPATVAERPTKADGFVFQGDLWKHTFF
jgi:hypothetical protein